MKRIFLIVAFLLSAAAAHAQSPTAACNSSNLNAAYSDNVNNVQYMCTAIGWKQNIGIGNPVVACAPKNYGQNYTDVSTPATFQCGVAGWFSITGGGGGSVPGGENQDVQFNNSGVFGGNSSLTFNPSTAALTIGPNGSTAGSYSGPMQWQGLYNNGSGLALDTYQGYVQIGSGVNPFSQFVFNHSSGTPGGGQFYFATLTEFANGVLVHNSHLTVDDLTPSSPTVCTDGSSNLTTSGCSGGGGGGALTPKQYGGYGDAFQIPNGCTTTASSASVTCLGAAFVSGDIGKELWVSGAGAAGVAYGAAITAVSSSTTVTLASAASTAVTTAPAVYGHDDVVAIQDCINASSLQQEQCFLGTATPNLFLTASGWLVASAGLQIPTHANIAGSSMYGGSTILSEYNGDLFSLTTGTSSLYAGQPVSGVTVSNLGIYHDPSQPAGRGFHINSAAGIYGFGGMYYTTFNSIDDENAALECLWLDGHTNSTDNPNQYLIFNNMTCDGPNQPHPANEIKITGIQAQILFNNGAVNGNGPTSGGNNWTYYPNPLVYVGEKTNGGGDAPGAVTFFQDTYEVGTQGLYIGNGSTDIHFDNGYVESVGTPLIVAANAVGVTYRGNLLANSGDVGAVAEFSGSGMISATIQDNREFGGVPSAAFAICSGGTNNFNIDFLNNFSTSGSQATSNCATNHSGTGAALFQAAGTTVTVDPSSQVINLIEDPNVQPGKTLTMYALGTGAPNSFSLASGGTATSNEYPINLGAIPSPLVVTAGNTVILALMDQGSFEWTVVGGTAVSGGTAVTGTTALATSSIASGACQAVSAGSVNSSAATGAATTSRILWTPAASLQTVTGYQVSTSGALSIDAYPTSGFVNFNVCNWSAGPITPGALTLNWKVE